MSNKILALTFSSCFFKASFRISIIPVVYLALSNSSALASRSSFSAEKLSAEIPVLNETKQES